MATDTTQVINSQNMATQPSVQVPTYTPTPVDPSIANSAISGLAGQYESVKKQLEQAQAEQKAQAESQLSLQNALLGKTADTQAANDQAGVNTETANLNRYASELANLNAQASSLNREAQAIPIANRASYQQKGIAGTESQVQNVNYDQLQQNALKALSIAQQADIAGAALTGSQIKLQAAKDKAQQMIDLKYKPIEDQLAIKKQQYELNKDILSQLDKKRTEALNAAIKKEEQQIADQKANEKGIADLVTNAAGQGAPADIRERASKAKTPMEAANILGVYAGDYLKNELLKEQLKQARAKTSTVSVDGREVVTENGVQLVKVTPKEIQDLNDTQIAKNSLVSLVDNMINSIDKNGTQVLFGAEAGARSGAKTNLLLAMKNLEKTGALDKGTIDVLTGTIPDSEFFATEAAQKAALQQLKDTVVNKTDEYINSYKGTTAETDPRTKRIYEQTGFISTGNKEADEYVRQSMNAFNTVSTALSTPNAMNAGYVDNQK